MTYSTINSDFKHLNWQPEIALFKHGLPLSDWNKTKVIYRIVNRFNGKSYVGQTKLSLRKRYSGKWWEKINNQIFQRAVTKYGPDAFRFIILESDVHDNDLNDKERYYILLYDARTPSGYNIKPGGERGPFSEEGKKNMKLARRKTFSGNYTLQKDGEVVHFSNIAEFAESYGLNKSTVSAVIRGDLRQHGGWHKPGTDLRFSTNGKREARYLVKDDVAYPVFNVAQFARDHGLNEACVHAVLNGRYSSHKGFTLPTPIKKKERSEWAPLDPLKYESISLVNDDTGDVIEVPRHGRQKFSKMTGIDFYSLLRGAQETSRGYRLLKVA